MVEPGEFEGWLKSSWQSASPLEAHTQTCSVLQITHHLWSRTESADNSHVLCCLFLATALWLESSETTGVLWAVENILFESPSRGSGKGSLGEKAHCSYQGLKFSSQLTYLAAHDWLSHLWLQRLWHESEHSHYKHTHIIRNLKTLKHILFSYFNGKWWLLVPWTMKAIVLHVHHELSGPDTEGHSP